jgi:hypothetical protein
MRGAAGARGREGNRVAGPARCFEGLSVRQVESTAKRLPSATPRSGRPTRPVDPNVAAAETSSSASSGRRCESEETEARGEWRSTITTLRSSIGSSDHRRCGEEASRMTPTIRLRQTICLQPTFESARASPTFESAGVRCRQERRRATSTTIQPRNSDFLRDIRLADIVVRAVSDEFALIFALIRPPPGGSPGVWAPVHF